MDVENDKDAVNINQEELADILNQETEEHALAALMKPKKTKAEEDKGKLRKVMDFKFRVLELIEIYLKKSKEPKIFINHIVPLIVTIKESYREKTKQALVNKLCNILKTYFGKDKARLVDFDFDCDEIISEVLSNAKKIKVDKIVQVFRFILLSLLEIKTKFAKSSSILQPTIKTYTEALKEFGTKRSVLMPKDYFKDVICKFPTIGIELFEGLICLINLKENDGARDDNIRNECLDLLIQLLKQAKENQVLTEKILHSMKQIRLLLINIITNHEKIKKKKVSQLNKYFEIFGIILTQLDNYIQNNSELDQTYKTKIVQSKNKLKSGVIQALKDADLVDKDVSKLKEKYLAKFA